MGLFNLSVTVPGNYDSGSGGPSLGPLTEATEDVAKATREATNHTDHRYTDKRQISAEERYGLINIWQEIFHHLGIWSVEQLQRTGIKLNDGKYNYFLIQHNSQEFFEGKPEWVNRHYLAHVSANDPYIMAKLIDQAISMVYGRDLLEDISIMEFKKNQLPKMKLGWIEVLRP